jgi:MFS family permease
MVLAVASIGHALCHVSTLVLQQVVIEAGRELGSAAVGWLVALGAFLMGFGAIPGGVLGDRFGSRRVYGWYLALLMVAGFAAATAPSVWLFAPAIALVGVAASFHHPVGLAWIAESIPEQRARAMGIHGFVGHFGSTLAPLLVLRLHESVGWRHAYTVIALAAALTFVALKTTPITTGEAASRPPPGTPRAAIPWKLALVPGMVVLLLAMVPNGLVHQGFWASWTSFLKDEVGATAHSGPGPATLSLAPLAVDAQQRLPGWLLGRAGPGESLLGPVAGALATLVLALGSFGELAGGWWARRNNSLGLYAAMNAASAVGLAGLCLLDGPWLLAAGGLFAFFHFGTQPVENDLIARRADPRVRGLAYGLKFVVSFGIGSLAAQPAIGGWQRHGFAPVFGALAGITVLGVAGVVLLARRDRAVIDARTVRPAP